MSFEATEVYSFHRAWPVANHHRYSCTAIVSSCRFAGDHERYIHTYTPVPSSPWQRLVSWFTGTYAEFYDSKFVAQGDNREVARVEFKGVVKVRFSVLSRGMETLGYSTIHHGA